MIYENIKELCDKRKISIYELEKRAGLQNGAVRKWQVHSPTIKNLQKVANVLGVTIARLTRGIEKEVV